VTYQSLYKCRTTVHGHGIRVCRRTDSIASMLRDGDTINTY